MDRGETVSIQRSIGVAVIALLFINCGSSQTAESQGTSAAAAAPAPSTSQGAVPEKLRSTIATTLKVNESRVIPTASFSKDLGADELSMVELVMAYEREFKIEISDADADRFTQVQDVVDYLQPHKVLR
jgi:acyl carrier protein